MTKIASNLQIDSARLWNTIHETEQFGATPKGGVRRLTLSAEDKLARDWFRTTCEAAGLDVHVDALGSMFAVRKGRDMSKAPVGLGSHLDMLHNTSFCSGIAHVDANRYWTFNGELGSLDLYDFHKPHPPGGEDHS